MGLINFKDIDFNKSNNRENKTINFNDNIIQITSYLPANEKYNLIITILSKSDETDLFNNFKTKFYFDLNLVLMYSNIIFSEEDKQDELQLYDTLKKSGLMDMIIDAIPENEKADLWENIINIQKEMINYRRSLSALITQVADKINSIQQTLEKLDFNQIKTVLEKNTVLS